MLKIKDLIKTFNKTKVIDSINIEIHKLDIIGLAGSSGCGKSTLLRLIQGIEKPDSGYIECNARRNFMFQDFQLFPHMTALENIIYAPRLHRLYPNQDYRNAVMHIIKNLGIEEKIDSYPHDLSGGEKQRIALARSLAMKPEILLCDEPTSGLDVATISDVVSLLQSIRDLGVTMLLASHDLDFLTKICDRIILLKNGSIAADITLSNIEDPINYLKTFY